MEEINFLHWWIVIRPNDFKLKEGKFRLEVGGSFFTERVMRCWNKFPRVVVDAPSLEVFKIRLGEILGKSDLVFDLLAGNPAYGR